MPREQSGELKSILAGDVNSQEQNSIIPPDHTNQSEILQDPKEDSLRNFHSHSHSLVLLPKTKRLAVPYFTLIFCLVSDVGSYLGTWWTNFSKMPNLHSLWSRDPLEIMNVSQSDSGRNTAPLDKLYCVPL